MTDAVQDAILEDVTDAVLKHTNCNIPLANAVRRAVARELCGAQPSGWHCSCGASLPLGWMGGRCPNGCAHATRETPLGPHPDRITT